MISLEEIAKYVNERGPKNINNPDFNLVAYPILLGIQKCGIGVEPNFLQKYNSSITERIIEILPTEGQIDLSSKTCTIIIYNPSTKQLEKALYDLSQGQPIPNPTEKKIANIIPSSPLVISEFSGHQPQSKMYGWGITQQQKQAAGFLKKLLNLSEKSSILEISQNEGDSFNRYFAYRTYN